MRHARQRKILAFPASDCIEAIERIDLPPYHVVPEEVPMLTIDGGKTLRRICTGRLADARSRFVAATANAMQGDREACLAAGMDDYVTKPIRVEALVEALNRVKVRDATQPCEFSAGSKPA
jgi:CheY-like chemotaxis protein